MPASIIFFTGAPDHNSLDWSEGGLLSSFTIPNKRHHLSNQALQTSTPSHSISKWRGLSLDKDDTPALDENTSKASEFYVYSQNEQEEFLDHSVAVLQSIDPEQLTQATTSFETSFTPTVSTDEYSSFGSSLANEDTKSLEALQVQQWAELSLHKLNFTDLKEIPSAGHILSVNPQTITANLIVGIVAISIPKPVVSKRYRNFEREIVELIVGDNTRAGFAVNIWLKPDNSSAKARNVLDKHNADLEFDLRKTLKRLRKGDVIALNNIALSAYRGNVFGQSLNTRFAKSNTRIIQIQRRSMQESTHATDLDFISKIESVEQWVSDFVGETFQDKRLRAGTKRKYDELEQHQREALPPDTQ